MQCEVYQVARGKNCVLAADADSDAGAGADAGEVYVDLVGLVEKDVEAGAANFSAYAAVGVEDAPTVGGTCP